MDRFIDIPNLPGTNVSLGIVDGRARSSILSSLEQSGIEIILTGECQELYDAVSYHPDMFIHHLGGAYLVAAPNAPENMVKELKKKRFNVIKGKKPVSRKYPGDIAYNVARIGEYAVCNIAHTDEVLLEHLTNMGIRLIDVKQGYAKCSICIAGKRAIITSDEGIYRSLAGYGFDILRIRPGLIELEGLDYGFIGGASGMVSEDTMAFTGNIRRHPDYQKIFEFMYNHGKKVKMLDNEKVMDVGTFIPLKEYCIGDICR